MTARFRHATLLALALAAGCMNQPRNGQTVANTQSRVVFAGYWQDPGIEVKLFAQNPTTNGWDAIPHAPIYTATGSPLKDNAGTNWYQFAANDVVIPSAYWVGSAHNNVAHVMASINGVKLTTFDVNADGCIQNALGTGGFQVMHDCSSSASPSVTLTSSCGALGAECCHGAPACDGGNQCRNGVCVTPCGQQSQACCTVGNACDAAGTACWNGTCQPCGALGEHCCNGGGCNRGSVCVGGTCTCGSVNEPCCPGHKCGAGGLCMADGQCHACGGLRQLCCDNNTCNAGTCVPSSPPQCACGDKGQKCCPGNSCNGGYECQGGVCADPSNPGPTCVGVGGACGTSTGPYCCSGELCVYGHCQKCIAHGGSCAPGQGEICCSWQDTCVFDQFTETDQCGIRDQGN